MAAPRFLLHHALVTAPSAQPARWMLMLHGILGSGANLRTFARRLAERCPSWGFVLVDLRMHGLSQGAAPPHTISATADDLLSLEGQLGLSVRGVLGHSFGGKVALAYLERRGGSSIAQAWVLDASPSAGAREPPKPRGTRAVLKMLRAVPQPLASRERFLEIVAEHGFSRSIAEWLAMNVRRAEDGVRIRLDLDAMDAMLGDYFEVDLWHVLERAGFAEEMHVVIGGRSDSLDAATRARMGAIPHVQVHVLEEAGHWVHVDALDELVEVVSRALSPHA